MEIFNRLESKRFELPKVKSSENAPLCDYCKKREAEYECEQCENETGETPIRFLCERHLERIRKHEVGTQESRNFQRFIRSPTDITTERFPIIRKIRWSI